MTDTSSSDTGDISRLARLLAGEPSWSWNYRYHPALRDHMHALGVVAANYNHLESSLFLLFYEYSHQPYTVSQYNFLHLNNNKNRLDILNRCIQHRVKNDSTELALHFVEGFGICAEKRNFLMHGMAHDALNRTELVLRKAPRNDPTRLNYMHLSAEDIRKIADEISDFSMFGIDIFMWLEAQKTGGKLIIPADMKEHVPSLPKKPPLPDRLNLSDHPKPIDEPPQLEPSRE
jgi:hypothetical protein